ncbi:hypothetical protein RZS08_46950, partial [Arthrospira platensis SPKY1]|nr:hypothetical protein [Arthrospira platensis SPKY1]
MFLSGPRLFRPGVRQTGQQLGPVVGVQPSYRYRGGVFQQHMPLCPQQLLVDEHLYHPPDDEDGAVGG